MSPRLPAGCLLSLAVLALGPRASAGTITAIAPSCAAVGAQVTIIGAGFDAGSLSITVGGVAATLGPVTTSMAVFTVPTGIGLGPTTVTAANPGSAGSIDFKVCDLLMPASWGGQWQMTITYTDAASGNPVATDQITTNIRAGELFGVTGADNLGACTGSVSDTSLSVQCGGDGASATCTLSNSMQISADLAGESIAGSGIQTVTLAGVCAGFTSFTRNIQITGQRISVDQNPTGPPVTLLGSFVPFSSMAGGGQAVSVSQIAVTSTGLLYSRVTRLYSGTFTVNNSGVQPVAGPVQIVFTDLTPGVLLANATGVSNAGPYITVPGSIGLAPGQTASVKVQFYNPSNALIKFSSLTYSGSF